MNLESFGEDLRKHREQKQISLSAISEATRISEKMLEAIEAGRFSVLPQTYIRAFLRAYARVIDLNPDDVIKRYDTVNRELRSPADEGTSQPRVPSPAPERPAPGLSDTGGQFPLRAVLVLMIMIAAIGGIVYLATRETSHPLQDPLSKVPFDKAVHETDAVVQPEQTPAQAQGTPQAQTPPRRQAADSLRLEMATTDSLWISVELDDTRKGEYLFPPGRRRTWTAKDKFVLSMGDAGAATFRLNGSDLGVLGKRGAVARNIVITKSGVQQPL